MLLAALLALAMLSSCGGNRSATTPQLSASASSAIDLSGALAELQAAPPPEGVDAALWEGLKSELADELTRRATGKLASEGSPFTDLEVRVFHVDNGYSNPISREAILRWNSSFFPADTNGDGAVNIADLTPIAVHIREETAAHPEATAGDTNRDGVVNIVDVTTLAANWGVGVGLTYDWTPVFRTEDPHARYAIEATGTRDECGFAVYQLELGMTWGEPHQAERVTISATDPVGGASVSDTVLIYLPVDEVLTVDDLDVDPVIDWPAVRLTWTSSFFRGDANQDGTISVADTSAFAAHWSDSVEQYPECAPADVDRDGCVGINDADELARLLNEFAGRTITGYQVEVCDEPEGTYSVLPSSAYSVEETTSHYGYRQHTARIDELPEAEETFVRVRPIGTKWEGDTEIPWELDPTPSFRVRGFEWSLCWPVDDVQAEAAGSSDTAISWSTSFFRGDGNQDGRLDLRDLLTMMFYFRQSTIDNPEATVADYNGDGYVSMIDVSVFAASLSNSPWIAGFHVEVMPIPSTGEFERIATVRYADSQTDPPRNQYGFRWYRYLVSRSIAPTPFWVRVIWFDPDGDEGEPSEPLMVTD